MRNRLTRSISVTLIAFLMLQSSHVLAQTCPIPGRGAGNSLLLGNESWHNRRNPPADPTETPACNAVSGAEANQCTTCVAGNATGDTGGMTPVPKDRGMMRASVQALLVSLALSDTPLSYRPAKGPAVPLSFYYSQRESYQPETFHYTNLGPKWTYAGLSYVIDDPARPGEEVQRYKSGGGTRKFRKEDYNPATGQFVPDGRDGSVLARFAEPLHYERRQADGTVETYAHSDGKTDWPRRFFLTERKDPAGNRLRFHYDAQNRLTTVEDATGQKTTLEYKHADPLKITALVDPHGRRAQIAYDDRGRLIAITDAIGLTSRVSYSGRGTFIERLETPYGVTRFASGSGWDDRWIEITDPLGRTERVEARDSAAGIPDAEASAPGVAGITNSGLSRHNTFYWDAATYAKHKGDYTKAKILHWRDEDGMAVGVLSSTKEPLESRLWYAYDPKATTMGTCKNPVAIARVQPDGATQQTRYSWNAFGNALMSRDPQGRETRLDYAPNGIDLTQIRRKTEKGFDALLQVTWNDQHRPLTVKSASGNLIAYTWNDAGQLTSRSNAQGEATKYQYDTTGQLITVTNALGHIHARYTWDVHGNLASETDSTGITLKHQYDALDRRIKTTWPDGTPTEYTWDKLDRVKVKDRNGKITTEHYDAVQNRIKTTDALRTVQYRYDASDRLVSLTDGKGNTTQWQRDLQGRVTTKITPDGTKTAITYDTSGRERTRTDALGQVRILTYGKDDKLIRVAYDKARNPTPEVRLTWDAAYPRIATITDGNGTTRYTYGSVGQAGALQRISEQTPFGDKLEDTYALTGQLQSRKLGAVTERMTYDPLGRVSAVENNLLGTFTYDYLGDSRRMTEVALMDGAVQRTYQYEDDTGNLADITHVPSARSYAYGSSPSGLIDAIIETAEGKSKTWRYQYDAIDRLEIAQDGKQTYRYALDAANNLSAIETPEGTRTYSSGTDNRIAQASHKFDATGNRTEDETRSYQWDAENRLIAIGYKKEPGKRTEFKYDGLSRRTAIIEIDGQTRLETHYTWCGDKICRATDKNSNPIAYYFEEGVVRPTKEGNQRHYYARDYLGSIRDTLDAKGKVTGRFDYMPYGALLNTQKSAPEFGYAGMQYHAPSGLYLTKYRAYDPKDGRWISRDPIEEAGGLNLYAYVAGNPVSYTDPLGLAPGDGCPVTQSVNAVLELVAGTTEAGTTIITGFFALTAGGVTAVVEGYYDWVTGKFTGAPGNNPDALRHAEEIVNNWTYTPRSRTGQAILVGIGDVMDALKIPPYTPGVGTAAVGGSLARAEARAVRQARRVERVAGAGAGELININPAELRWTQRTAGGNGRADVLRESIGNNGYSGAPIDVVRTVDGLVTVDHTRAAIALEQGITSIPARVHLPTDPLPDSMLGRFGNATTWGEAIANRAANQRPSLPPTGTSTPPRLPPSKN